MGGTPSLYSGGSEAGDSGCASSVVAESAYSVSSNETLGSNLTQSRSSNAVVAKKAGVASPSTGAEEVGSLPIVSRWSFLSSLSEKCCVSAFTFP